MKLFTNGCSFTWGGELYKSLYDRNGELLEYFNPDPVNQERLTKLWPHHLANHLGATECVNLSMGSGSNDRIVRTTLDFFTQQPNTNGWTAVIQWAWPHRFEYWEEETQAWTLIIPSCGTLGKNGYINAFDRVSKFKDEVYKNYNDYTYSQKYWTHVVSLANFFNANGIKYYFVNLLTTGFYNLLHEHQRTHLETRIRWIGNGPRHNLVNMFDSKFPSTHPTELGHQQIADYFYQRFDNANNIYR